MESRHFSLNLSEVGDVTDLMLAFERHNAVRLEVRLSLVNQEKNASIAIAMLAHGKEGEIGEVPPLGSVSAICSAINLKTLRDVLTHVMYALDFQLALREWDAASPKR